VGVCVMVEEEVLPYFAVHLIASALPGVEEAD
jgi:hypothetical protein